MTILHFVRSALKCKHEYKNTVVIDYFKLFTKYINTDASKMLEELGDTYVSKEIETRKLEDWFFKPDVKSSRDIFKMILPPPNITGTLHLGHALTATIQDVLVKWHQMNGVTTLWIPGMDHAGIATQVMVEKRLWADKRRTRHDIGRDEFIREVWKFKKEKSEVIGQQLRRLGLSLNWDHEFFTLDERQSKAVREAFIKLHSDGLIYESDAPVNWSCAMQSAISDVEVEHLEISRPTELCIPNRQKPVVFGHLTEFAYILDHDPNSEVIVATTRPETILGDVALAVHPADARHTSLIGKLVVHPFDHTRIPIIADDFVDPNFGSGVVKLTPGHNHQDYECCLRHNLPIKDVFNECGQVRADQKMFAGMDRFDVREEVLKTLESLGLLRGRRDHQMSVPMCSRSKDVVETLVKPQWFIDCQRMAELALDDVRDGRIRITPERFEHTWEQWLKKIRPWCISRQLWWGHRIPAYRCSSEQGVKETIIARSESEARQLAQVKFGSDSGEIHIVQVDDVLDTWFSSALLPLTSERGQNGWKQQQPLNVMETGHDILFFWVARMAMLCTHLSGHVPFSQVLLHGVVCDVRGRKMSKSLGNVIAPEDIIDGRSLNELEAATLMARDQGVLSESEAHKAVQGQRKMFPEGIPECGVDALRFTLCSHNVQNHFIHFDALECRANKFFGNKIWQATKFTLKWRSAFANEEDEVYWEKALDDLELEDMDRWILSRLNFMLAEVNDALSLDNFHDATAALKQFLYFDMCDVYLESCKRGLRAGRWMHVCVLHECLTKGLRALAPFMPHLSQHLFMHLSAPGKHAASYPRPKDRYRDGVIEQHVAALMDVVIAIRRLKQLFNVTGKYKPIVIVNGRNEFLERNANVVCDLASCADLRFESIDDDNRDKYFSDRVGHMDIHMHVPEELQSAIRAEGVQLYQKRAKLAKQLEKLRSLVSSPGYNEKVSATAQRNNMKKIDQLQEKITRLDYIKSWSAKRQ